MRFTVWGKERFADWGAAPNPARGTRKFPLDPHLRWVAPDPYYFRLRALLCYFDGQRGRIAFKCLPNSS